MSTHKHIDRIALLIILTVLAGVLILFAGMGASGERTGMEKEYETGLFSTDQVHTIEITMDDWEGFLEDCENEEYVMCDVTIDRPDSPGGGNPRQRKYLPDPSQKLWQRSVQF